MSDYIYMLESHLSPDQNRVVEDVQAAAAQANVNLFLTGGAMRDMLAGFRIRDLDFVVEGPALKVAKAICERTGAKTGVFRRSPQVGRTVVSQRCHGADCHVSPGKAYPRPAPSPRSLPPPSRTTCADAISLATPSPFR